MGDFSRNTDDPRNHYSGVLMQQGRVQLDADWNEQVALQLYRTELEAIDVIGSCGVPKKVDGFRIGLTPSALDLTISPGRMYVEGLLCELEATPVPISFVSNAPNQATVETLSVDGSKLAQGQWVELSAANKTSTKLLQISNVEGQSRTVTFNTSFSDFQNAGAASIRRVATLLTQPEFPSASITGLGGGAGGTLTTSPPASPLASPPQALLADGLYLVFIHAWKREITALDDPHVREVALGGPDTATRLKNIWQVKLLSVIRPQGTPTCKSRYTEWDNLVAPSTGRLNARTKPPDDEKDPCLLPPTAGFTRLENQLYRVEVQRAGDRPTATFKWSRDNAVVRTKILNVDSAVLTVADVGRDDVLGFAGGQWVEITDEESVLKREPRQLCQIDGVDATTREITLKTTPSGLANRKNLQLVRWDQFGDPAGVDGVALSSGTDWIDLEGGVQVQFSEGIYRAGDHWLIPARTATGEIEWPPFAIPNNAPEAQPPLGIQHHFCRLALIEVAAGIINLKDCRKLFPSLTDICAEDVCFDNANCKLPGVETVQEALDRLCAASDLRFHNKHLHGWGIVCGLQVECGSDPLGQQRRHVTVRKGYAIDCEGNDILVRADEPIDLLSLVAESTLFPAHSPPASPPGALQDTEVCLVLESNPEAQSRYRVEPYPKDRGTIQSLLKGTLLMDFFNECVQSLVDFYHDEFTPKPEEETVPVGPTQKRITTFSNLLIQLTNKENGAFVFLSGDKGKRDRNFEDTILREFYTKLRAKLQSHTFCAMFENARPFPEYPYASLDMATIFSKGFQTRLRVAPGGNVGYSVGAGNTINVFDLRKGEMVRELEFPGGPSAAVRDVAFSMDGRQLYLTATIDDKDSMFVVADVSGFEHVFRKPTMICDVLLVTLGTSPAVSDHVFAIGKGKGLYAINPQNADPNAQPLYPFNAVGHLVIAAGDGTAFASASSQQGAAESYNRVLRLNLATRDANPPIFPLVNNSEQLTGADDIALAFEGQERRLYVVVSTPTGQQAGKRAMVYDIANPQTPITLVDLQQDTAIRLAHNPVTKQMMATYEDSYRVGMISAKHELAASFMPVQISPLAITTASEGKRTYVLNYASNTISSIPSELFAPEKAIALKPLVAYRADALEAFADLFGGLLQYLKDCFCDHLLVDCPKCEPEDKLYLACISIKNGEVFKVCNFSLRKYVHSFPTWEYWLSLVPVLPLAKKAVEELCCAVLPSFFGRFQALRPEPPVNSQGAGKNVVRGEQIRTNVRFIQQADFRAVRGDIASKVRSGRPIFLDSAADALNKLSVQKPAAVAHTDVAGQNVDDAKAKLTGAGIVVENVEPYDPKKSGRNLFEFTGAPIRLEPGAKVKLVTRDDKVLFYARAEEPAPEIGRLRAEFDATRNLVDETRTIASGSKAEVDSVLPRLEDLNAKVESNKSALDEAIPALSVMRAELEETRKAAEEGRAALDRTTPQIEDLRAKLAATAAELAASKASVDEALRLRAELGNVHNELLQVRQGHQQEMLSRDREIAELRTTTREFQTRITDLQVRIDRIPRQPTPPPSGASPAKKKRPPRG